MDHASGRPIAGGLRVEATAAERPAYEAYRILQFAFVVAPIVMGLDKFFHFLVNWDQYLAPFMTRIVPVSAHTFMSIVGVIEIIAGIGVALKPRIFAYVIVLWLIGIIVNVVATGYYDIAMRDLGLALGALALARIAREFDRH